MRSNLCYRLGMKYVALSLALAGLSLTAIGSYFGGRGGLLSASEIEERAKAIGVWHDSPPDWLRADLERNNNGMRIALRLIGAGTLLQAAATIIGLFAV